MTSALPAKVVTGLTRRQVVGNTLAGGTMVACAAPFSAVAQTSSSNAAITKASPITPSERGQRIDRVQAQMRAAGVAALLVEAGSSLTYFTGVQWGRSERLTGALIPAAGEVMMVTPGFEESRVRELLAVPSEVRVWQEDEDPSRLIADWLVERQLANGVLAIEDTVRFFAIDGLRSLLPDLRIISGGGLVNAVRMYKSPAEIALMQQATDITIAAYRQTYPRIESGMGSDDIMAIMGETTMLLGAENAFGGCQIGAGSALPHGSKKPELVHDGAVVLMDCGCTVDGYHSDVSRTFVFGEPGRQQRTVWQQVHRGQEIAFAAAEIGAAAGTVDDAVRRYYETLGYGPGYKLPGLSHRTGHGIGLDVHEPVNLVHGEMTPLAPGMCFSNEPGIYIEGAFGIRLEDCFYMTPGGPRYFSQPPPSIDQPFG